jgi:hypothetical protein
MKRNTMVFILLFAAVCTFAQSKAEPQVAYRILSDYVFHKEANANDKAWTGVMLGIGGTLMLSGAATWFLGDAISEQVAPGNTAWTLDTKMITTAVLAGTGAAMSTVGLIGVLIPPANVRKDYDLIYKETDPVVQEALSVAALKDMADKGRDRRITNAVIGIATPIVTLAVQSILNVSFGKPWNHNYESVGAWQIPSVISSTTSLFSLSDEERLFEKYLAARSAIYAAR